MMNRLRAILAGLMVGSAALFSGGCAGVSGSVAFAPGADGYYDYDYYPDSDIYFYPQSRVYFWHHDGDWYSGRRLPRRYHLHEELREHLRLHSREPWREYHPERREFERGEHRQFENEHRDRD